MQSLDATTRPPSFSAMLSGGSDPCFGSDHGGHHDFTTLNGSSTGSNGQTEFGHLMNSSQHHHHHHHHSHHSETNNNNTSAANHNNNPSKPKKVPPPNGKKTKGRVKIKMEFIDNKLRRYTTFSKRKTGIMKKAYELSTLTGTQVMLLVASETGHVYTFATRKLQPMITSEAGKALIQTCLNSPDPPNSGDAQRMSATGYEETELTYAADPNGSDHGDTKVRLTSSPYSNAQAQSLAPLHHSHSASMYGSPLNNSYHSSPGVIGSAGMIFPHSPSPNGMLYHYASDPQPPQCYPSGLHSPTPPHLTHLTR